MKKGHLIIISGPSGVGKGTVINELMKQEELNLKYSVSCTTREIRENEIEGKDYYFISVPDFEQMIDNNEVLEYAKYGKNLYGTPKAPVDKWLDEGKIVILKIEVQGAGNIKKLYPDAVGIFILPPSMDVLEQRLRTRGTENEDDIIKRLEIARNEIEQSNNYDFLVINDDLDKASENVLEILHNINKWGK